MESPWGLAQVGAKGRAGREDWEDWEGRGASMGEQGGHERTGL